MKALIFVIVSVVFRNNNIIPSSSIIGKHDFSNIFNLYSKKYDTLIVYTTAGYPRATAYHKIIGSKKGKWSKIDYFERTSLEKQDSVVRKPYYGSAILLTNLLQNRLLTLPNEAETLIPCRTIKDTLINGQAVTQINDLNGEQDLEYDTIEFKIGRKKQKLAYRSVKEALNICPDSEERILFFRMIETIKGQ